MSPPGSSFSTTYLKLDDIDDLIKNSDIDNLLSKYL